MGYRGVETRLFLWIRLNCPGCITWKTFWPHTAAVWGDVPVEIMARTAREFGGVEHRMELVREICGVKWYNDSIGTSPTRTIAGLKAFGQKIILIAGGYDKKIPYEPLAPYLCEKVSHLILMGATGPKIQQALETCPGLRWTASGGILGESMEQAVQTADGLAGSGDIVALSPASASFDLYPNFEKRGEHFKKLVAALKP